MTAPMWQVVLSTVDADDGVDPVTDPAQAEAALQALDVEYDELEEDDAAHGIWLVGLLGRYADEAWRGDEVWEQHSGYRMVIPQP